MKVENKGLFLNDEDDEMISWVNFINMLARSFYELKYSGAQLLFHPQNYAQLYQCAHLEVAPNFYFVCSIPGVHNSNLMAGQKKISLY